MGAYLQLRVSVVLFFKAQGRLDGPTTPAVNEFYVPLLPKPQAVQNFGLISPRPPSRKFGNGDGLDHSNPCGTGLPAFAMDKSGEGL